jgi:putative transcriptional regulator
VKSTAGRLLVASPLMGDPNFERSVVLMLEHDDESALGLVLTDPTTTAVGQMLPQWASLTSEPDVFFLGGPVSYESVISLGWATGGDLQAFGGIVGDVGIIDLNSDPAGLGVELAQIRVFAGYSGWGRSQLESELALDAWFVVDAHPTDVFTDEPHELWSEVLRRQRGPLAWLANYPVDPSLN